MWRKVHGILCREKFISRGKNYLWSMVVSPWNLNLWFLDHGISTDVLIPSIELMVLVCYGFGPWYWSMIWGRACLYKAKEIIWLGYAFGLNILRSKILGYCFKSSIYMKVKCIVNLWRVISRVLQLRKCGGATGDATKAPQTEGVVRRRHRRCSAEAPQETP